MKKSALLLIVLAVICLIFLISNHKVVDKDKRDSYLIDSFTSEIEAFYQLLKLKGVAVGVGVNDSLLYFKGFGYADANQEDPITDDHIFEIASITKSFTSVVLHQLQEEKVIALSNPLSDYPNRYFDERRFVDGMTLDHIISHTSESNPPGTHFIYNGSKYNMIFNIFDEINDVENENELTKPFTTEIERRIIHPLGLHSTVVRYDEEQYEKLKQMVTTQYLYDKDSSRYINQAVDLRQMQGVPSTGFLSSTRDLLKFSNSLDQNILLNEKNYDKMTSSFYPGSPYGRGWFTSLYEGVKIHWTYGLGATNSALLVRIPAKQLSLVVLSNTAGLNDYFRLGYGNPMYSTVILSFLKYFVFQQEEKQQRIDYESSSMEKIEERVTQLTEKSKSTIYIEEAFSNAMFRKFAPESLYEDKSRAAELLNIIYRNYPDYFQRQHPEMFELIAAFNAQEIPGIGNQLITSYHNTDIYDPVKSFYAGLISEELGQTEVAVNFFSEVADDEQFTEQPVKFKACMKLAAYYRDADDPVKATTYLKKLITYKETISSTNDAVYRQAKALLETLSRQ